MYPINFFHRYIPSKNDWIIRVYLFYFNISTLFLRTAKTKQNE